MSGGGVPDDDDVTIWAGRLRSWPMPPDGEDPAEPDDATIVAPGRSTTAPDDATVRARPRTSPPADGETLRARPRTPAPPPDDETALALRRVVPPVEAPAVVDDATALRSRATTASDRARPRPVTPGVDDLSGRRARVPEALGREIYRPRAGGPAFVERATPAPRAPQEPVDVESAVSSRGRRARRRAIVFVAAAAVIAALAVAAIVWIVIAPA